MATRTEAVASTRPADLGTLARRGGTALVLAVLANAVLVFLADLAAVAPDLAHLSYGRVAVFTALGVIGATAVYGVLTRLVDDPDLTFAGLAAVLLVLSMVPTAVVIPGEPGATTLGTVALGVAHVPPAVAAVAVLTNVLGRRRATRGR